MQVNFLLSIIVSNFYGELLFSKINFKWFNAFNTKNQFSLWMINFEYFILTSTTHECSNKERKEHHQEVKSLTK